MRISRPPARTRRKAVWGPKRIISALLALIVVVGASGTADAQNRHFRQAPKARPGVPSQRVKNYKMDDEVTRRSKSLLGLGTTRVILTLVPGAQVPAEFRRYAKGGKLDIINGQVLELPNGVIKRLSQYPEVFRIHYDRPLQTHNYRTSVTTGALTARQQYGYSGAGIGIAVIDSGITSWHNDLTNQTYASFPYGNQRVKKFVDFVNGQTQPYDDNGHGTHVAGIIAGNGQSSMYGQKAGVAPDASLIALKVLNAQGTGTISNIIAAFNWIVANRTAYNIKVVNLSIGAPIRESYWTDPLTLAAKAVVERGVTVVVAAGNFGKNAAGQLQYGGITAPANAPWVLTVGASSTEGTNSRSDDKVASYSSAGPTYIDFAAKPDLVAPGTGTVSLSAPGSLFYTTKVQYLVNGLFGTAGKPYLALSGTSMAAPVVTGTVALMLQANPHLTPNLVKAILQYTAQVYPGYDALRQGAGFLNTLGAVRLARFYRTATPGAHMPVQPIWSKQIIWGNHRLTGGYIVPAANAWDDNIVWGTAKTLNDDNIVWGTMTDNLDNIVWGTSVIDGDNIVWGTSDDNVVWGTFDDNIVWGTNDDNIVWGTSGFGDNIVWGTGFDDNIVWGADCGGADCDNIVWGTSDDDNIVWGTSDGDDNVVWGTAGLDVDNVVWGTSSEDDVTWGNSGDDQVQFPDDENEPVPSDAEQFGDVAPVVEGV